MTRIAVVGGGPGGGAAALALARGGCDVTLFRPARPGEKPCGGALPAYLLKELEGLEESGLPSVPVSRAILENADGVRCHVDLTGLRIYRRRDLDPAIARLALEAGARIIETKVEAMEVSDGGISLGAAGGRWDFEWVIAADGARSLARRTLAMGWPASSFGVGATIPEVMHHDLVLSFPGAADSYVWIFPRPGGVSVGIAYGEDRLSHGAARAALDNFLVRWLPRARTARASRYRYPIPVYSERTLPDVELAARHRVLLVGDAAGLADPLTREGIRPAVRSGLWAAEALLTGHPGRYPGRLASGVESEMDRALRATRLFYDDPIGQWMVPLSRVHPGIRRVLADLLACRQPYLGLRRRLLIAALSVRQSAAANPDQVPNR